MIRVDLLPENELVSRLKTILSEIDNLKKKQLIGSRSLVVKQNTTSSTWDVSDHIDIGTTLARWRVTFTPTNTSTPYVEFQFNYEIGPPPTFEIVEAYPDPSTASSISGAVSYIVEVFNGGDSDINMRFAFKAADTGTITWLRLADL